MPEGHTIHRLARKHRQALAGHRLATASPQGRFAAGARQLDGRLLEDVEANGKHLFYRWKGGQILHIHLGLFGRFRLYRANPPEPSPNTRLVMTASETTVHLAGPTICELISPEDEEAIRARLGPDPLQTVSAGESLDRFRRNLSSRRIPIGAALLDQRVIAGIGNVYRAEALFLTGIDPRIPAQNLSDEASERLWSTSVELLQLGERMGRIVTVEPGAVGARKRTDLDRHERLYVYKRRGEPCRRCRTTITSTEMAGRNIWWCPDCQPAGAGRPG